MKTISGRYYALSVCAAAAILAGCGGSQPPIGAPGVMPQSRALRLNVSRATMPASTQPCPAAACMYVSNSAGAGSITVYPTNASGNSTPYRTISGEKTRLTNPYGIAVDSRGKVYVSIPQCEVSGCTVAPALYAFAAGANGDVKPLRSIARRAARLRVTYGVASDNNGNIYALNAHQSKRCYGRGSFGGCLSWGFVTVYAAGSKENVAPIRTIKKINGFQGGISVDSVGQTYVTNSQECFTLYGGLCWGNTAVLVYAPGADGHAAPSWTIGGSNTGLISPEGIAVDDAENVYVTDNAFELPRYSVYVYAAGEHGNVAPVQVISGSKTGLNGPSSVAVDAGHNIYVVNSGPSVGGSVTVYAAGATGNVAPIQTIEGSKTGLSLPFGIAIH